MKKPCSESGSRALRCSVCPYLILEGRRHQASAVDRTRPAPRETRSGTYRCGTVPDFDRLPLHGPGQLHTAAERSRPLFDCSKLHSSLGKPTIAPQPNDVKTQFA